MDIIVRLYTDSDAAAVAKMWNESSEGWPGGFLPFIDFTEERIRENMREAGPLAVYLALLGDEVVGFCSLKKSARDRNVAYVPLLNAHPNYHGKKIGKKVFREVVRESIERGFDRLDLHTWSGNMKGVPLYKKTGFFWVPETEVYMQNFMPLVFQNPIASRYFDKHDWYQTMVRDLSLVHDEMSWNDREAYLYEGRDGDDFLKIAIDRHCGGITSIETPEFCASSRLGAKKPAIGLTHIISWHFKNTTGKTMTVAMRASGDKGLEASHQAAFKLDDERELETTVKVSADFSLKGERELAAAVSTDIVLDGESFKLKTGVKAKHAVELVMRREHLTPGVSKTLQFRLKNQTSESLSGKLMLIAPDSLSLKPNELAAELKPNAVKGIDVEVLAETPGAFVVRPFFEAMLDGKSVALPARRFALGAASFGDVVATSFDKNVMLQNESLRLIADTREGFILIHSVREDQEIICHLPDQLGEPFSDEFRIIPHSAQVEETHGGKALIMRNRSEAFPGLELEKRITLCSGPLLKFDYMVRNVSAVDRAVKLRIGNWSEEEGAKVTIPLKEGILNVYPTDFPSWDMDLPDEPERFAESWGAFTRDDGIVCGLIWHGASKIGFGGGKMPFLTFDLGTIPAYGQKSVPTHYLYMGDGDFRTVRRNWEILTGQKANEELPEMHSVAQLTLSEDPIFVTADGKSLSLKLSHLRNSKIKGSVCIAGVGVSAEPSTAQFENVSLDKPYESPINLRAEGETRVASLEARVETQTSTYEKAFPVFFMGRNPQRAAVLVDEQPKVADKRVISIDNGEQQFFVSPDYAGALFSLKRNGAEHLLSPFPEQGMQAFFNPWFGGVKVIVKKFTDSVWQEADEMHKIEFRYEKSQRADAAGNVWQGVRLSGALPQEDLQGLSVSIDYLTLPGSNVLAVVPRVINQTDAAFRVFALLQCFPSRQSQSDFVAHYVRGGEFFSRKSTDNGTDMSSDAWLCAENRKSSRFLTMVGATPDLKLALVDVGSEGQSFFAYKDLWVPPFASAGLVCSLATTSTLDEAKLCRGLQSLRVKEV